MIQRDCDRTSSAFDYPADPGQYRVDAYGAAKNTLDGNGAAPAWRDKDGGKLMDIRKITDELSVAPQIQAEDVAAIAAAGFRAVICNRPDGESTDQPCCEDIAAAVAAQGLAWRTQPVRSGGITQADVEAFGALLAELPKPMLAYCRSGTRCAMLWCLSQAGTRPLPDILQRAQAAGYDMSAVMQRAVGPD
jgi:sulfide:quinone oxidoreductase